MKKNPAAPKKSVDRYAPREYDEQVNYIGKVLQGRVQVPTGGIAHEPRKLRSGFCGMIRCNSEADSRVWMKEECDSLYELAHKPVHGSGKRVFTAYARSAEALPAVGETVLIDVSCDRDLVFMARRI